MNTRLLSISIAVIFAIMSVAACATGPTATVRSGGRGPSISQARAEPYDGLKARLAVVKFVNKSARGGPFLGSGMADMMVTELFKTNRYILLDRQDIDAVINEQDFADSGRVSEKTASVIGQMEGADLLVMGAVTEFQEDYFGVGGILVGALTLGASIAIKSANRDAPIGAATYKESYVVMDMKIMDARTGRVVYTGTVRGNYQDWGGLLIGGIGGGASRVPVGLGGFAGTGAEQAIRACIHTAVADIVKNTPPAYYRVRENGDVELANQLVAFYPVNFTGAHPTGPGTPEARIIDDDASYARLIADLGANAPSATDRFNWSTTRLLAVFDGKRPTKGYRVGIEKVVRLKDFVEARIRRVAPAPGVVPTVDEPAISDPAIGGVAGAGPVVDGAAISDPVVDGPDWPYDVVRIDKPDRPIRFIWE